MRDRHRVGGLLWCLTGLCLMATIPTFARYGVHHRGVAPLAFMGVWLCTAAVLPAVLGLATDRRSLKSIGRHKRLLALIGMLHLGTASCAFVGLQYVSAPLFAFISAMAAPGAFALGIAIGGERPTAFEVAGLMAAVAGLALFVSQAATGGADALGAREALGIGLIFASASFNAVVELVVKRKPPALPEWSIMCARNGLPGLLALAVVLSLHPQTLPDPSVVRWMVVGATLGPFLGWYCYFRSLRRLPLTVASVLRPLAPVLATLIAAITLGESLRRSQAPGAVLVVLGVALVSWHNAAARRTPT